MITCTNKDKEEKKYTTILYLFVCCNKHIDLIDWVSLSIFILSIFILSIFILRNIQILFLDS